MLCRQCGAQIRKENKRPDGLYQCPGCGKVYRVKQGAASAKANVAPAKKRGARKPSRGRIILAAIAAAAVLLAVILALSLSGGADETAGNALQAPTATAQATAEPTPQPTATAEPIEAASVHFRAVGDIMSHKLQLRHAKQDDGTYNYDAQFMAVKEALSKADYTIANLELSISADGEYSSYPYFRTPEAILDSLKDCGVDMFTLANNHILDGFFEGLEKTVESVDERGFDRVGAFATLEDSQQPLVKEIGGIKFGFLAYTKDVNENDKRIDSAQAAYCVKRLDGADFQADVQALRDLGAEVVICMPHWGEEGKRSVSSECKQLAQEMVNAGVDIILGSHPHVVLPINVGPMEVNGQEKDVLIAWSMGNFISYMAAQYMDSGIIVDFTVSRDETGKISIHDVGYVPVYVWGNTERFHLICSGDFYSDKPDQMSSSDFKRMKQSVKEIASMIGEDGVTMLQN